MSIRDGVGTRAERANICMVGRVKTNTARVRVHSTEVASDHPTVIKWDLANASCHGAHIVRE